MRDKVMREECGERGENLRGEGGQRVEEERRREDDYADNDECGERDNGENSFEGCGTVRDNGGADGTNDRDKIG